MFGTKIKSHCVFFFLFCPFGRFDKVMELREEALDFARKIDSDYILFVDSDNFLHNENGKDFESHGIKSLKRIDRMKNYRNLSLEIGEEKLTIIPEIHSHLTG